MRGPQQVSDQRVYGHGVSPSNNSRKDIYPHMYYREQIPPPRSAPSKLNAGKASKKRAGKASKVHAGKVCWHMLMDVLASMFMDILDLVKTGLMCLHHVVLAIDGRSRKCCAVKPTFHLLGANYQSTLLLSAPIRYKDACQRQQCCEVNIKLRRCALRSSCWFHDHQMSAHPFIRQEHALSRGVLFTSKHCWFARLHPLRSDAPVSAHFHLPQECI